MKRIKALREAAASPKPSWPSELASTAYYAEFETAHRSVSIDRICAMADALSAPHQVFIETAAESRGQWDHPDHQDHVRSRQENLGTPANKTWESVPLRMLAPPPAAIYSWVVAVANYRSQSGQLLLTLAIYRSHAQLR
ncbi:hypothetical protein [Nonomuraea insulae]|uniref:Helix-turn-helix protein n=1 Tax=Nonomuraea insulae TaxID=1616787 RepID=A0ABW1D1D2_9ACTN